MPRVKKPEAKASMSVAGGATGFCEGVNICIIGCTFVQMNIWLMA